MWGVSNRPPSSRVGPDGAVSREASPPQLAVPVDASPLARVTIGAL